MKTEITIRSKQMVKFVSKVGHEMAMVRNKTTTKMILAALFAALTALGAFTSIPLYPVPVTLQSFFTLLAGAVLGSYFGALSQTIYLLLGCVGTPVFAGGKGGFEVLLGPTGGYLLGFIAGAFVEGKFIEVKRNPSFEWILISMLIGTLTIYAFGVIQLSIWMKTSMQQAVLMGVFPFLIGDFLKILAAAYTASKVFKLANMHK